MTLPVSMRPTPKQHAHALRIVTSPENYQGPTRRGLRVIAWATLKAARGQTVNQTRLTQLALAAT